jgi:hypothetical protein
MGGAEMGVLKAGDGPVATLNKGLQVRETRPESIHVPLKQIYDGWTRRGNAGIKKESLLRLNL